MPHGPLNLLTDIDGLSVGHATDLTLGSGVTVIVFDDRQPPRARCSAARRVGVT